jgi:hypothetical protein
MSAKIGFYLSNTGRLKLYVKHSTKCETGEDSRCAGGQIVEL